MCVCVGEAVYSVCDEENTHTHTHKMYIEIKNLQKSISPVLY